MKVLFSGQVPKDLDYPESLEDSFEIAQDRRKVAVSDGASESFDSKIWAQLLASSYLQYSHITEDWLKKVIHQYNDRFNFSTLSWSQQGAYERGSYATLLGVEEFTEDLSVDVLSIGDSLAVLLDGVKLIDSFFYKNYDQFALRPELICSNQRQNNFINSPKNISRYCKTWYLYDLCQPIILCMTDALGEWALRMEQQGVPQWERLLSVMDFQQLESIVLIEREQKRLKVDDVTLVSLAFEY